MSTEAQFKKATEIVQGLPKDGPVKPTTDEQLFFYSHFKQGMLYQTRVSSHDLPPKQQPQLETDAWKQLEGTGKEEAMKAYVKKLLELLNAAGDPESKKQVADIENA